MRINNIPVAGLNPSSRLIPYNDGSGFTDSPIEVIPPFEGFEGQGGLQTHIGSFILAPPTLSIPPFGFKFANDFVQGSLSQIGDTQGFYQTSVLNIVQFPNSGLTEFSLVDNFNNTTYMKINPSYDIFSLCNSNTLVGMQVDGSQGWATFFLNYGLGLDISSLSRRVLIGNSEQGQLIGVDYQNNRMYVGNTLMEDNALNPTSRYIRVISSANEEFWIQLYQ